MFSYNRVNIIGYQTQPVSIRQTPGGTSVTDLNLVVPYRFKSDKGDMLFGKSFHPVTCWGGMADMAGQYIKPGSQIFISGRLQTDTWEDQQTGEKRSKTRIVALDMIILDPKDGQKPAPDGAPMLTNCVNRAEIVGNLTRDPELRTTTNGHKVLSIGVATNERWRDKSSNETKERAEFHNVVLWGDLAEVSSKALSKGSRVFVSGRLQNRAWETAQGAKRTTTEIVAEQVSLCGIENPVAQEAVQAEALRSNPKSEIRNPKSASLPAEARSAGTGEPTESEVPMEGVGVAYASEIKAEDLPF